MFGRPLGSARARRAAPSRPGAPSFRGERGQVTWVTVLLLAAVVGGGVLGWAWFPVYLEHYAVKQVVRDYMNQAVKNPDDQMLRRNMVLKIRSLAEVTSVDEWGRSARVPAIPLDEGDVTWERDTSAQPPILHIAFDYVREVTYPVAGRTTTTVFTVDLTNDLARADWGPAR